MAGLQGVNRTWSAWQFAGSGARKITREVASQGIHQISEWIRLRQKDLCGLQLTYTSVLSSVFAHILSVQIVGKDISSLCNSSLKPFQVILQDPVLPPQPSL